MSVIGKKMIWKNPAGASQELMWQALSRPRIPKRSRLSPEKKVEVVDETEDDALNNGTAKKNPKRGRHQVVVRAPSSPFQKIETRLNPNARPSQC